MKYRMYWAVALMLIYSIPFLIIGVYLAVDLDSIVNMLMTDPLYADYVDYYGWTYDQLHDVLYYASFAYILSSVCGIVSSVLCWKRTQYWVALILCIVCSPCSWACSPSGPSSPASSPSGSTRTSSRAS